MAERPHGSAMCFGEFRVLCGSRTLLQQNTVVPLGGRAFDLLVVLLRSRGRLVAKDEILREVWPSIFVDETNLRFQMGCLRKALGSERHRIKTIPGRGYMFARDEEALVTAGGTRTAKGAADSARSVILVVEPDADQRTAMTMLLRALKVSVLSFTSVDELAAYTRSPGALAAT